MKKDLINNLVLQFAVPLPHLDNFYRKNIYNKVLIIFHPTFSSNSSSYVQVHMKIHRHTNKATHITVNPQNYWNGTLTESKWDYSITAFSVEYSHLKRLLSAHLFADFTLTPVFRPPFYYVQGIIVLLYSSFHRYYVHIHIHLLKVNYVEVLTKKKPEWWCPK